MSEVTTNKRAKSGEVRQFILEHVKDHPKDIASFSAQQFGISRQAINRHLQHLTEQNWLEVEGTTRNKTYRLKALEQFEQTYALAGLEEHRVWGKDIAPRLLKLKLAKTVMTVWEYGFTEMLNNAIDHSNGTQVMINLNLYPTYAQLTILDNGEGIFRRVSRLLNLDDERHAVLELSKGKLTTDPANHSGEGIFFTSRLFDEFIILSGKVFFSHTLNELEDWIIEGDLDEHRSSTQGTLVEMELNHKAQHTVKEVFDLYASGEDFGFVKTVVPVRLAQYGNESLISRSQAKRVLARVDRFKVVIFDFEGVESIGQAFADEIFRVFKNQRPDIELQYIHANPETEPMILRALNRPTVN
jgi:anti-sigma regulatory factor (Ser/Thr protein kinase)